MPNQGRILSIGGSLRLLFVFQLLLPTAAHAQDDVASRRAAAERYEATMPITKLMEESVQQLALSLPENQQRRFIELMTQTIDGEQLRTIALDKMTALFSTEELDALAAFYGSPVGQSIVTKFPVYMAEVIPAIQLELERAVRELNDRSP